MQCFAHALVYMEDSKLAKELFDKIEASEMTNSKLKLWDYFTPSLYELLKSKAK